MTVNDIVSGTRDLFNTGKVSDEVAKFVDDVSRQDHAVPIVR